MERKMGSSLDGLLALSGVLKLLRGDLVEQVAQAVLDDVVGDLLVPALRARGALHRRRRQRVELGDVPQHGHRLHDSMQWDEATVPVTRPKTSSRFDAIPDAGREKPRISMCPVDRLMWQCIGAEHSKV